MLTGFLVVLPDVFFRVPVKRLLAAGRAKVIRLAVAVGSAGGAGDRDVHVADRVVDGLIHRSPPASLNYRGAVCHYLTPIWWRVTPG